MNILNIFSRNKKQKTANNQDMSRLVDENKTFRAAFTNLFSSNMFTNWFNGEKIKGSMNYPSITNFDLKTLRNRSRKAMYDTPQAAAAIFRLTENVINSGLTVEMTPIWDILGSKMTKDEKEIWTKRVEQMWKIYSNSKDALYDRKKTFQQSQSLWHQNYLRDGEIFLILRYSADKNRLNPLSIQQIDPENVNNPSDSTEIKAINDRGNHVADGIEYDSKGEEIAYFITDTLTLKQLRIEKFGQKSQRLFVIHAMRTDFADQTRGIPFLTGILNELQKITDYSLLELQAAVINAIVAVWVEPAADADSSQPFSGVRVKTEFQTTNSEEVVDKRPDVAAFNKGGLIVQNLKKGEKLASYDTKRPNVNFEAFTTAIMKSLSSSLSIPMEVLTMTFGQNYSASRATLILFWNKVIMERANFEADVLDPILEMWMIGEVEAGRIEASGFATKLLRAAWMNNRWVGISQPSIDPLKEANAVDVRLKQGTTTREIESQKYNGTSFDENVQNLKEENQALQDAQPKIEVPIQPSQTGAKQQ